jgi:hypothetical protein
MRAVSSLPADIARSEAIRARRAALTA